MCNRRSLRILRIVDAPTGMAEQFALDALVASW
jgi:hypothetical protein